MTLTKDIIEKAIRSGHDSCIKSGCIHAQALADAIKAIHEDIGRGFQSGEKIGSPSMGIYNAAFHAGYRAAQLELEQPAGRVN